MVGTSRGAGPVRNLQENPNFPHKKGKNPATEELSTAQIMGQVKQLLDIAKERENKMVINLE